MKCPINSERVRGRVYEYTVTSAPCTALIAARFPVFDGSAAHDCRPSGTPHRSFECDRAQSEACDHANRLEIGEQVVLSTIGNIRRSSVLLADLRESIALTLQIIRASQQLIRASDLTIARARTLNAK